MSVMMDQFIASGVGRTKIERFLDTDSNGNGTIRDQIAADMANELMAAFGRLGRQTGQDVKRIRERGRWVGLDKRPSE